MVSDLEQLIGIDGGGTRGRFAVARRDGTLMAAAAGGPLNPNNVPPDTLAANLTEGFSVLKFDPASARLHAGIAGIKTTSDAAAFGKLLAQIGGTGSVRTVNDIELLLCGGLSGRPGIAAIFGTGSHAMGRNASGQTLSCGGWGYLLDDAGSGYAIGHQALRTAVRMWDGRLGETALARQIAEVLAINEPGEALHQLYNGGFAFAEINNLGQKVVRWAAQGEPGAERIVQDAVKDGVELIETLARRLAMPEPEIVLTGGIAENPYVLSLWDAELREHLPGSRRGTPDFPPLAGAVIGAATDAGLPVDDAFLSNLRKTLHVLEPVL
jgi:N-acetylglucosamine kinase-like BadF-type ATPase